MRTLIRLTLLGMVLILGACAATDPLEEELPDMGDFQLGYNIVVADNMQQVPPSRTATEEEWVQALTAEIDRRFGGYDGDRLYHIALHVDAYSLAPPGIPVVLQPRSILVISANVWDDELQAKLHDEPEQLTIFEGTSADTFLVGSGIARSREEQMQVLARNAARRVQLWMLEHPEWFSIDEEAAAAAQAELAQAVAEVEQPVEIPEDPAAADAAQ
ncbi:hypothetical protein [Nioella nitratireducens]|uniref:hypothetical protein n=1 Tax=Nioella nitratireducens TaxID=1287720 RepID=UPI0008FD2F1F|nr:hypothetical protein [Nioella nitratireducens]